MAIARITAATALPAVRQLASALARWSKDAGVLTAAPDLGPRLEALATAPRVLYVDVLLPANPHAEDFADAARRISPALEPRDLEGTGRGATTGELPMVIRTTRAGSPRVLLAGEPRPSVLVVAGAASRMDEAFSESLADLAVDRPLVILPRAVAALAPRMDGCHAVVADETDPPIEQRLAAPAWAAVADLLIADGLARALESVAALFAQALEQEARGVKAKRALAQQRSAPVRSTPVTDLTMDLRGRLQRGTAEFMRGLDERAQLILAPPIGLLSKELESALSQINRLDYSAGGRQVVTTLPPDVERGWFEKVASALDAHTRADVTAVRDFFRMLVQEIDGVLTDVGAPSLPLQIRPLPEDRRQRVLEMHVAPQRRYTGEMQRAGMFEYLMMARRYQMMLFMLISALGAVSLRRHTEFMLPAAVLLLTLGGLNVVRTTRAERAENQEKELARARETLRTEMRRILSDVQRAWTATVAQYVADQSAQIQLQVEALARDFSSQQQQATTQERQRLQRQLQGLETAERKLAIVAKGRDTEAAALSQFRGELRQLVVASCAGAAKP